MVSLGGNVLDWSALVVMMLSGTVWVIVLPWVAILCLESPLLSMSQFELVWSVVFLLGSVGMAMLR